MKKLEFNEMEIVNGGSQQTDLVCAGLGFMYGLANPLLGLAVGLGCTMYYW